jgi:hypothetical protein
MPPCASFERVRFARNGLRSFIVFFTADPDNVEPFVLRPVVFAVFEIILVNMLISGSELRLRIGASAVIAAGAVLLAIRAHRKLR